MPRIFRFLFVLPILVLAGCAAKTTEVYHKPGRYSREDAQIDVLTCAKAEIEARRTVLRSSADRNSPVLRRRAFAAGQVAARRCLKSRGYTRRA